MSRQNVQRITNRLIKDGFIDTADNPAHRRAKLCSLSALGKETMEEVKRRQTIWANEMSKNLDVEKLTIAVSKMKKCTQKFHTYCEETYEILQKELSILFDTLADWEIGYITAGINNPMMQVNPDKYQLKTFSIDGKPIRTIGGLQITPDLSLDEVSFSDAEMLILPGGKSWDDGGNQNATLLAKEFHKNKIKVAAICGATLGLAKIGLFDSIQHTSNSKDYLLNSHYQGGEHYVDALSVSDKGVITASGTASLEFAREIFKEIHLYKTDVLEAWYTLFKTSSPDAFFELMKAVGA